MYKIFIPLLILLFSDISLAEVRFTPYSKASSYIGNGKPVMLELGTKTCVGCKKMNTILEPFMKAHPRYQIFDVLINERSQGKKSAMDILGTKTKKSLEEKLKLNGYPYQIFYNAQGKESYRHAGVLSRKQLESVCKKLGF